MDIDYPASHSMDCLWWAVDKDGHVAVFSSGEAGAVPTNAAQALDDERLAAALPSTGILYELEGRLLPREPGPEPHVRFPEGRDLLDVLMFLKSEDLVRQDLQDRWAVRLPGTPGVPVYFHTLTQERSQALHRASECLGCVWGYINVKSKYRGPEYLGFYRYDHLCENWISGPYGREVRPEQPVHLDQLPPDLRAAAARMRFNGLCFAETAHIQPVDHGPCDSWEVEYLLLDGKTQRPMPGR